METCIQQKCQNENEGSVPERENRGTGDPCMSCVKGVTVFLSLFMLCIIHSVLCQWLTLFIISLQCYIKKITFARSKWQLFKDSLKKNKTAVIKSLNIFFCNIFYYLYCFFWAYSQYSLCKMHTEVVGLLLIFRYFIKFLSWVLTLYLLVCCFAFRYRNFKFLHNRICHIFLYGFLSCLRRAFLFSILVLFLFY